MNDINTILNKIEDVGNTLSSLTSQADAIIAQSIQKAFTDGFMQGVGISNIDLENKVFVIKTNNIDGALEAMKASLNYLSLQFNCQFVFVNNNTDIKELDDTELKALGLQRIK